MKRPRLALDVQFSGMDVLTLESMGFDVIVQAEHGEPDASWMSRALDLGVEMICSPDSDCEIWAYDRRIHYMKVPGNKPAFLPGLVAMAWRLSRKAAP